MIQLKTKLTLFHKIYLIVVAFIFCYYTPLLEYIYIGFNSFFNNFYRSDYWTPKRTVTAIFFGFLPSIFLVIMVRKLLQNLKGRIYLNLPKKTIYHYGDMIEGSFLLHMKKEAVAEVIEVKLKSFLEYEKGYYENRKYKKKTKRVLFYESTNEIATNLQMMANEKRSFNFKIKVPQNIASLKSRIGLKENRDCKIDWFIRVNIKTKGLDLDESHHITIK